MLYRVVTKQGSVTKIHFRSYSVDQCWNFVRMRSIVSKEAYVVVDSIDRILKPKTIKDDYAKNNFTFTNSSVWNG
jgi:mannose/fructose/N-acetylgalactosamine-specific phosphotransferase system component IID